MFSTKFKKNWNKWTWNFHYILLPLVLAKPFIVRLHSDLTRLWRHKIWEILNGGNLKITASNCLLLFPQHILLARPIKKLLYVLLQDLRKIQRKKRENFHVLHLPFVIAINFIVRLRTFLWCLSVGFFINNTSTY
jgi:hypothetical protein